MSKRIKKWASQWPLWGWAWIATYLVLWVALVIRPTLSLAVALIVVTAFGVANTILERIRLLEGMLATFLVKSTPELEQIMRDAIEKRNREARP